MRVMTESGSVILINGPHEYIRNGKKYECLVWGMAELVQPTESPNSGSVVITVPGVTETPFGKQTMYIPVRILPGRIEVGALLAFVGEEEGQLKVILSAPVVSVEEGNASPLPEDLLKKLTD